MAASFPDVCIAGAGIIGLSLALELDACGLSVLVLEAGTPLGGASSAAAGMLAAHDPENPVALLALAELSLALYPEFLGQIEELGGGAVPFQTSRTLQSLQAGDLTGAALAEEQLREICPALVPGGRRFVELEELSLDPRMLGTALLAAVRASVMEIRAGGRVSGASNEDGGVMVATAEGAVRAGCFVDCTGAWSLPPIAPKKGQMLSVELPDGMALEQVVRTSDVYVVPRRIGPQAGRVVIGATVEDAGFDMTTRGEDIARLHALAGELLPLLAAAPIVEQWAGLRPGTPDDLPMLGQIAEKRFLAAGHFRNGILLAPATARLLTQLVMGEAPAIDIAAFSPGRFGVRA